MCTCDFTLSEIDNEEMSIHDVIQATVDDFNQTIDYLAKHRRTQTCLRHLYETWRKQSQTLDEAQKAKWREIHHSRPCLAGITPARTDFLSYNNDGDCND